MKQDRILISLSDPIGFVRRQFREYAVAAVNRHVGAGPLPIKHLEYDAVDFFVALVDELSNADESASSLGTPPESTNLLVQAGFDPKTATWIAFEAYKGVTDAISTIDPQATFGPSGDYQYALVDELDLLITRPAQGVQIPYGLRMGGPSISDEIKHVKKISDEMLPTVYAPAEPEPAATAMPGMILYRPLAEYHDPSLPTMTSRDIDSLPGGLPPEARE